MMRMQPTDRLLARSRGQLQDVLDYLEPFDYGDEHYKNEIRTFLRTLFDLCLAVGLDFTILTAESQEECFYDGKPWNNRWARERLNFANMGVTGDPAQNEASHYFKDGAEFARSFVAHILLYATGKIDRGGLTPADDVRYEAYIEEFGPTIQATTIAGLANKYAKDNEYANTICQRANEVLWPKGLFYTVTYAKPVPMKQADGTPWTGDKDIIVNDTIIYAQPRLVRAKAGGQARVNGSLTGTPTRAPYSEGEAVTAFGWFRAGADAQGEDRYWVLADGSRLHVAGAIDKPLTLSFV